MKYNLFIVKLINELSSSKNANNDIMRDTNDNIQIHINIVIRNKTKFQIPNRGNFHKNINTTIQAQTHTVPIFNRFLKNH